MKDQSLAIGRFLDVYLYGEVFPDRCCNGRRRVFNNAVVGIMVSAMRNRAGENGFEVCCHG